MKITDKDKAQIVNYQFSSAFATADPKTPEIKSPPVSSMDDTTKTTDGVRKLFDDLNAYKTNGTDGIQLCH